jgi:hypothetical protein
MSAGVDSAAREPGGSRRRRSLKWDVLAWAGLAAAVLAILWPLGLTNRVLAGLDAFTYFEPYWAYRNAALSAGRVPLWNPYLFLGVPFLANPQAAVLYPLHWPLMGLQAERALVWSALLHAWLAAGFTYVFARRSYRVTRPAAWLAGLLFGLGGFTLARVENINQLNALAWLPATLWLYDETARASNWRGALRWATGLVIVIALQLLAGHTQTAYVNLVGLGLYALYKPAAWTLGRRRRSAPGDGMPETRAPPGENIPEPGDRSGRAASGQVWLRALLPLLAVLPAMLLIAAQLLPSLELNGLGLRTGGLDYRQAVSFSLRPHLLLQSLLPPFSGALAEAFGSEGYAEFVAYVGITGLVLAALAVIRLAASRGGSRQEPLSRESASWGAPLLLALAGLFLALGAANPLYYVLWRLAPGFGSFRAPVRWLELTAIGLAVLAASGLDQVGRRTTSGRNVRAAGRKGWKRLPAGRAGRIAGGVFVLALAALLAYQQWPAVKTILLWLGVGALAAVCVWVGRRRPRAARAGLITLAVVELWLAGRALPFTLATAPYAFSLRNAPAALLAQVAGQPAAGRDRFLSMSDIRYDPGDLTEMRELMAGSLSSDAIERLVRSAKQTEVIAPNLPLRLSLPAVDGYDGGLLPTQDYGKLQTLFLPADQRLMDGRMREQLRQIPAGRLLDLTGVRFVITDKQNDLWADNVYYDLEQAAELKPGEALELDLTGYPRFPATALGVVSHMGGGAADGAAAAEIEVRTEDGQTTTFSLRAGSETAAGAGPAGGARVARAWPDSTGSQGQDYLAQLDLGAARTPASITVRVPKGAPSAFVLQGLSLIDGRTGAHQSVTVSPGGDYRRIHTGDVKVYERTLTPGRVWLVHGVQPADNPDAALRFVADPSFDPKQTVVVEGNLPAEPPGAAQAGEGVTVKEFSAEKVVLEANLTKPGVLVLADAFYPGWQAAVDGVRAPILRSNLMFRAVALEPGRHDVSFSYEPSSWRWGILTGEATLVLLVGVVLATFIPARRFAPHKV